MYICNKMPYKGWKIYGPYNGSDKRERVVVSSSNKRKRTVSYPKFLMELKMGRNLDPNKETIDHIDGNFLNNSPSNIRLIERSQHAKEDAVRVGFKPIKCVKCGNFVPTTRIKSRYRNGKPRANSAGPFCNKSCSGKYGTDIQNNRTKKLPTLNIVTFKYKTKNVPR